MSAHNYHYIRVYFSNYRHIYTCIVNGIWNICGRLAYSVRNNSVPMAEWKLFVANEFVISTSTLPYRRLRYDLSAYRWRKGAKREDGIEWHTERTRGRERGGEREREVREEKEKKNDIARRVRARVCERSLIAPGISGLNRSHHRYGSCLRDLAADFTRGLRKRDGGSSAAVILREWRGIFDRVKVANIFYDIGIVLKKIFVIRVSLCRNVTFIYRSFFNFAPTFTHVHVKLHVDKSI